MADPDIDTDAVDCFIDYSNAVDHMIDRVLDVAVDAGNAGVATEAVGKILIALGKYLVAAELENRAPKVH
jgi:catabolite regulation protein CreA